MADESESRDVLAGFSDVLFGKGSFFDNEFGITFDGACATFSGSGAGIVAVFSKFVDGDDVGVVFSVFTDSNAGDGIGIFVELFAIFDWVGVAFGETCSCFIFGSTVFFTSPSDLVEEGVVGVDTNFDIGFSCFTCDSGLFVSCCKEVVDALSVVDEFAVSIINNIK